LGTQTRLDLGAGVKWAGFPVWSPDGSRIVANVISENGAGVVVTTIEGPAHVIPLSDNQSGRSTALLQVVSRPLKGRWARHLRGWIT